ATRCRTARHRTRRRPSRPLTRGSETSRPDRPRRTDSEGSSMRWLLRLAGALPSLVLSVVISGKTIAGGRRGVDSGIAGAEKKIDGLAIKNDPPELLFSEHSAVLVLIDGDPVYRSLEGTDL